MNAITATTPARTVHQVMTVLSAMKPTTIGLCSMESLASVWRTIMTYLEKPPALIARPNFAIASTASTTHPIKQLTVQQEPLSLDALNVKKDTSRTT